MRIVIDTSALYRDLTLDQAYSRLLLAASRNGEIELVVSEVVILEAVNKYRERLDDSARAVEKARQEYRSLGVDFASELPDIDASVEGYEAELRHKLDEAGARIPAPPDVPHLDIVKRAVAKHKPFDAKGRGYRDTLIWFQVREEATADHVVLVTANTRDFAAEDGSLADELKAELETMGLANDRVELADSLPNAVRSHIEPSAQALTRLEALLTEDGFRNQIAYAVQESVAYKDVTAPEDEELSILDVRDVQIDMVEEVRDLEIDEAYDSGGGILSFNIGGTLTAEADFYPLKSEIAGAHVPGVSVLDWDWNEWVVRASKSLEFGFEGFGEYDQAEGEVTRIEAWLVY